MTPGLAGVQRSGHAIGGGRAQAHHWGRVTRTLLGRRVERVLIPVGARLKVVVHWWPNVCRFAGLSWTVGKRLHTGDARGAPASCDSSGFCLTSNARSHVVQRLRPRSLPAQLSSLARPLCPSPPSIIIRHIVRGGILTLGAARVARAVAFGLCWPPGSLRSWPANQLIPMSSPAPCSGASAASAAGAVLYCPAQ